MQKPNFFIVGMPRAGTTSLWNYLQTHPEIYMSQEKEPNHFYRDKRPSQLSQMQELTLMNEHEMLGTRDYQNIVKYRDRDKYLSLFSDVTNEKIIGEASTRYIRAATVPREIYNFNPEAKILISLRNPVDVIHSLYYLRSLFFSDIGTFSQFAKLYIDDKECWLKLLAIIIEEYCSVFGEKNVKIIFFEDLQKDSKKVYLDILSFLDLNPNFMPKFKAYNSSKKYTNSVIKKKFFSLITHPKINHLRETISQRELGLTKVLISAFSDKSRPAIETEIKKMLILEFLPTIQKLEQITKRDLSHWHKS